MEETMNTAVETTEAVQPEQGMETTEQAVGQSASAALQTEGKENGGKSPWHAEIRRKAREKEREAAEATARFERLYGAIQQAGYEGTPEDIIDKLEADARGMDVQALRAERQRIADAAKADPVYQQAIAERDTYKQMYEQFLFQKHLDVIKAAHPEEQAANIADLGETFIQLMALKQQQGEISDEDVLLAYDMAALEKQRKTKPIPESPGKLNKATAEEKEYYTPEDVDRLSEAQLDNPQIRQRVFRSMTRWK